MNRMRNAAYDEKALKIKMENTQRNGDGKYDC